MLPLLLLSGCLINQDLYDRRRAELTAAEGDTDDTDDDTGCTPLAVWVDADGDGWGTSLYPDTRCGDLAGWATREGDCDDADGAVNPDATELCATLADDDCDGVVNEAGASDGEALYADADGDGFGDASAAEIVCTGEGWVADATDCDDGDDGVHPGAEEVCGTGVDEDCDGGATECRLVGDISTSSADVTWVGEAQGEAAAWPSRVGDLSGDGIDDVALATSTGLHLKEDPGAGELDISERSFAAVVPFSSTAPWFRAAAGDFDDDGQRDLVVSAIDSSGGIDTVVVFDGPVVGSMTIDDGSEMTRYGAFGFSLASITDTVGRTHFTVGAPEADSGAGAVYLYAARPSGEAGRDLLLTVVGAAGDSLGYGVAAGDMNGDGLDDLVISAPTAEDGKGAVRVFHAPWPDYLGIDDADTSVVGRSSGDRLGGSLVFDPVTDADGDGNLDLLVAAPSAVGLESRSGVAYVFAGPFSSSVTYDHAAVTFIGANVDGGLGSAVSGGGDIDGDDKGDLLIGAGSAQGKVYLVYGSRSGGGFMENELENILQPRIASGGFGSAVLAVGDVQDNGADDFVMSDTLASDGVGETYLIYGLGK